MLDRASGADRRAARAEQCGFRYRSSVFKHRDRHVVLAVTFRLRESAVSGPLRYAELARALGVPVGGSAPLADVREAVLALRRGKGMVIDPADPDSVSAGSFFTNPILEPDGFARLQARAGDAGSPPAFPEPDGRDQDLRRLADRARRLPARLRRRPRRHLRPSTRSRSSTAAARPPPS